MTASDGAVCLDKIQFLEEKSGFVWTKFIIFYRGFVSITATSVFLISNISSMGRPKRLYPLGRYRLHVRGEIDPAKQYLVQLEYTWNRQVIRKGMNIFVRLGDWNEKANKGRGGVRASYGPEANRINSLLLAGR